MTKYIKTTTAEFEQFDGSNEMFDKYELIDAGTMIGTHHSPELYLTGSGKVDVGDWIATGVNNEHRLVKDEIFKKTYEKVPVIPECVDQLIKRSQPEENLLSILIRANFHRDNANLWKWIFDHPEQFARAWLDGYEVKDE